MIDELTAFVLIFFAMGIGAIFPILMIRGKAPEAFTIMRCRNKKKPMGRIHWANGKETWELLEKGDDNSMFFVKNGRPFKIDMRMYQEGKTSFLPPNLELIDYFVDSLLPIGPMDAKVILQTDDYLRDPANGFNKLRGYSKLERMIMISIPEDKLDMDIMGYIHVDTRGMNQQQAFTETTKAKDDLIREIKRAKEELKRLPVMSGVFCIPSAYEAVNNPLVSKIGDEMEIELREMNAEEGAKKERLLIWVFAIVAVIIAGAVAIMVISNALK